MNAKDLIIVEIDGKSYPTYIDAHGVQRFFENSVLVYLLGREVIDLNTVAIAYNNGMFSAEDYLKFNMMLGYSVDGLADIHDFFGKPEDKPFTGLGWTIDNPLWK